MPSLYKYLSVFFFGLLLGMCIMFAAIHRSSDKPMPTGDADVPRHDVDMAVPVKALDKKVLRERKAISGDVTKAPEKEVLATGTVKTSDGKKTVAAVLDTKTGDTTLIENRAFMEFLSRHETGLGYGFVDGDLARAAQYRWTFGRIWRFYGTVQAEAFQVDRPRDRNPWNAMLYLTFRW